MIQVTIHKDKMANPYHVQISGHAGYAEHGKDIVCASVSMLFQTVGYTLEEREDTCTVLNFGSQGFGTIRIQNPTRESYLIMSAFETGIALLSEQYPHHVSLEVGVSNGKENT